MLPLNCVYIAIFYPLLLLAKISLCFGCRLEATYTQGNHFQDCRMFEINKQKFSTQNVYGTHIHARAHTPTHRMRCIKHKQRLVLLFNSHKTSSLFFVEFLRPLYFSLFAVRGIWMEVKATANRISLSYSKNFFFFYHFCLVFIGVFCVC